MSFIQADHSSVGVNQRLGETVAAQLRLLAIPTIHPGRTDDNEQNRTQASRGSRHSRARRPIDVGLLRRRGFGAAAALNFLLPVALFGSLILIPLYYQVVRHDSPVQVGLLLGPQGIGAALALPAAGSR